MISIIEKRLKMQQFVLIAEIGVNYYDIANEKNIFLMDAAKLMIQKAYDAGVHAVKFQSYKANTLASKDSPYYWDIKEEPTDSQYKLFQKYDLFGETEYKELSNYCETVGIEFLSTAFDKQSADYLNNMMNIYKISSSDLNNLNFIEYQAKKDKTIILSVGASNESEIDAAVATIRKYNDKPIVLMHCVLEYPTPIEHANLNKIQALTHKYPDLIIGYSDHTKPDLNYEIIKTAYNLGARVIEKHFTLNKKLKGNDHYHAMDDNDAKRIIEAINYIDLIRGDGTLRCLDSEMVARKNARRSLVAKCRIAKGEKISEEMLTWKRPASGINAEEYYQLVGKKAVVDISEDDILKWEMFE